MDSSRLGRLGGVAAVLGGLTLMLYNTTELALFSGAPLSALASRPGWVPFQVIGVLGSVAIALGLIAIYSTQAERAGRLGVAGFVLSFAGAFGYSGTSWAAAFVVPAVSRVSPSIVDGPDPLLGAGLIGTILLAAVGWVLFGIATIRAGVFPRSTGVLIIVANVIPFVLQPLGMATQIGPIALGVAMTWMGYRIVSSDVVPTRIPALA